MPPRIMPMPHHAISRSECRPGDREQDAFGDELGDDAPATGPQCGAHGDLAQTAGGAGELQVGDVDAGDQQHEDHREEQHFEYCSVSDSTMYSRIGIAFMRRLLLLAGYALFEPDGDAVEFGGRLRDGAAGLKARAGDEVVSAAIGPLCRSKGMRRPEFCGQGEIEGSGHHADDHEILVVQADSLADDGWVGGEAAAPQSVAEHHFAFAARVDPRLPESRGRGPVARQGS